MDSAAPNRGLIWTAAAVVAAIVTVAGVRAAKSALANVADAPVSIPTARVTRGALEPTVYMRGDVRAARQHAITAPPVGGALRILEMAESGEQATAGDIVLRFDPADQEYALEQAESELREAEQNIIKRRAEIAAGEAADEVALLTARFNVRRAELDARIDPDLIPANEYRIRQVSLEEAQRTLVQTGQDVEARRAVNRAALTVLEESRARAQLAADRARQNLEMLEIRAPINGAVEIRENLDSTTVLYVGMTLPEYRTGDLVGTARPIIDIFDMSELEIRASVNELDRVHLSVGQKVTATSDSAPGVNFPATIRAIGNTSLPQRRSDGPLRRYEVTVELDTSDPRLRPGTRVRLVAAAPPIENVLTVPRQAVFEEDGRTVVYVQAGESFEARDVTVVERGDVRAAVEGIAEGAVVALVRPSAAGTGGAASRAAGPAPSGGAAVGP